MATLLVVPCGLSLVENLDRRPGPWSDAFHPLDTTRWVSFAGRDVRYSTGTDDVAIDWLAAQEEAGRASDLHVLRSSVVGGGFDQVDCAREISAETNTVNCAPLPRGWEVDRETRVLLLASDTPRGLSTACAVGAVLNPDGLDATVPDLGRPVDWRQFTLLGGGGQSNVGRTTVAPIEGLRVELRPDPGRPGGVDLTRSLSGQFEHAIAVVANLVGNELSSGRYDRVCLMVTGGYKPFIPYLTTLAPYLTYGLPAGEMVAVASHDESTGLEAVEIPLLRDREVIHEHVQGVDLAAQDGRTNTALEGFALRRGPGNSWVHTGFGKALDLIRQSAGRRMGM